MNIEGNVFSLASFLLLWSFASSLQWGFWRCRRRLCRWTCRNVWQGTRHMFSFVTPQALTGYEAFGFMQDLRMMSRRPRRRPFYYQCWMSHCENHLQIADASRTVEVLKNIKEFQMKPREVKAYLDRYIIEQDWCKIYDGFNEFSGELRYQQHW